MVVRRVLLPRNDPTAQTFPVTRVNLPPLVELEPPPDPIDYYTNKPRDAVDMDNPLDIVDPQSAAVLDIVNYAITHPIHAAKTALKAVQQGDLIPSANPDFTRQFTSRYDKIIIEKANDNNVDPRILKQVLIQESSLDPNAVGDGGRSRGIAQFIDSTWADWGNGEDRLNPIASIDAAARYLRWLVNRTGDYEGALESYNGGIGNYERGTVSDAAEDYADKIISRSGITEDANIVYDEASP